MEDLYSLPVSKEAAKLAGISKYFTRVPCIHGHLAPRRTNSGGCFECHRLASREDRKADPVKFNQRKRDSELKRFYENRIETWAYQISSNIRHRARKSGIEASITAEFLTSIATTHCPIFGVELIYRNLRQGRRSPNSASVDRIDPTRGYVEGNMCIISSRANRIKNDATAAELRQIADWLDSVADN